MRISYKGKKASEEFWLLNFQLVNHCSHEFASEFEFKRPIQIDIVKKGLNSLIFRFVVICNQNEEQGHCDDSHNDNSLRYFYNKYSNKCVVFRYSGCNGNMNNFRTIQDCQETCGNFCKFSDDSIWLFYLRVDLLCAGLTFDTLFIWTIIIQFSRLLTTTNRSEQGRTGLEISRLRLAP